MILTDWEIKEIKKCLDAISVYSGDYHFSYPISQKDKNSVIKLQVSKIRKIFNGEWKE